MRDGGRIAAAIEILDDFETRRVPLKVCIADWSRGARYAGAKDRAFISGLALDVLRRKGSLLAAGGNLRGAVALALHHMWGWPKERIIEAYAEEPHGPGALSEARKAVLEEPPFSPETNFRDVPDFTRELLERVTPDLSAEIAAASQRAPIDLRVNTLKSDTDRALKALSPEKAVLSARSFTGLRIPAPSAESRGPAIDIHPAYQKGWVEVQDEGSQLAALAAGSVEGAQVLDYCAGGGGKTLALAALMKNYGQIHAYDIEARRLAPIFDRARRAGVRNLQVISPFEGEEKLTALKGKMDVVFVDAPCSGSGTWRRKPDTKWRLSRPQLEKRMEEQDQVLTAAAEYVKPGGQLIYVTCSLFVEENEDRIAAFWQQNQQFMVSSARDAMIETGLVNGLETLPKSGIEGTLRLSPATTGTDGFAITRLTRTK
ncbi:RsmB/NOP family class I SAM-dependent RNA methyltransferase [Parvularcula marina]|uniref:RsmB/NOP family class I SAM-dependent RNA methyltransferase n=2 Tax=Parvularcula marina TaxID=2292771 RepID=A0A371REQ5_9PROT|nr:RsmB/NOP family class I SAM-dependent RNA methyltransferase [Parvularcula marina]